MIYTCPVMAFFSADTVHVALVGRTNTGKSTLFNRLVGKRYAIEGRRAHLTQDIRIHRSGGVEFADFPGIDPVWFQQPKKHEHMKTLIQLALDETDLLLWILDAQTGVTAEDIEIFEVFKRLSCSWVGVINKVDHEGHRDRFLQTGLPRGEYVFVSASHKLGIQELESVIENYRLNNPETKRTESHESMVRIACVGRTNAGKSSFCNQVLGAWRMQVSRTPHTTRDLVELNWPLLSDQDVVLMDTAGLLTRRAVSPVEHVSLLQSRRAIQRADIVLFFVDATVGVRELDKKIYDKVSTSYATIVVVVNKWDLEKKIWQSQRQARVDIEHCLNGNHHTLFHSTLSSFHSAVFQRLVQAILEERSRKISTQEMNTWVRSIKQTTCDNPMARQLNIKYAVQKAVAPLRIYCFGQNSKLKHSQTAEQAKRMLARSFREHFGLRYGPVFFSFRKSTVHP